MGTVSQTVSPEVLRFRQNVKDRFGQTTDVLSQAMSDRIALYEEQMDKLAGEIDENVDDWRVIDDRQKVEALLPYDATLVKVYSDEYQRFKTFLTENNIYMSPSKSPTFTLGKINHTAEYVPGQDLIKIGNMAESRNLNAVPNTTGHEVTHFLDDHLNGIHPHLAEGIGVFVEKKMLEKGYYKTPGEELNALKWQMIRAGRVDLAIRIKERRGEKDNIKRNFEYLKEKLNISPDMVGTQYISLQNKPYNGMSYYIQGEQFDMLWRQLKAKNPEMELKQFLKDAMGDTDSKSVQEFAKKKYNIDLKPVFSAKAPKDQPKTLQKSIPG